MTESLPPGIQSRRSAILGWVLFITFLVFMWNIIVMPRTPLDQRGPQISIHNTIGTIVFVIAWVRLYWWFTEPSPEPPDGLPAASFAFNRAILFAIILVFGVEGFIGFGAVIIWHNSNR